MTTVLTMSIEEAITTQRAIRRLKTDPVDDELVLRLIELATKAPTGYNEQNWEFIVIRDPAVKAKLARANRQALRLYLDLARLLKRNDPPTLRAIAAGEWQRDHFEEIPGDRGVLPARTTAAVPTAAGHQLLRLDLPIGPEPAARCPSGGARRGADDDAVVEHEACPTDSWAAAQRDSVRVGVARMAARPLRTNTTSPRRRSSASRPVRESTISLTRSQQIDHHAAARTGRGIQPALRKRSDVGEVAIATIRRCGPRGSVAA